MSGALAAPVFYAAFAARVAPPATVPPRQCRFTHFLYTFVRGKIHREAVVARGDGARAPQHCPCGQRRRRAALWRARPAVFEAFFLVPPPQTDAPSHIAQHQRSHGATTAPHTRQRAHPTLRPSLPFRTAAGGKQRPFDGVPVVRWRFRRRLHTVMWPFPPSSPPPGRRRPAATCYGRLSAAGFG